MFFDIQDYYVSEKDNKIILEIDAPGFSRENLGVSVEGKQLKISGERRNRKISRSFSLSPQLDINSIDAELKDGLLTVSIHKTESKKIDIHVN